jgi:hypothetical protein
MSRMYSDVRERQAPKIIQTISSDLFIGAHGSKHHSAVEVSPTPESVLAVDITIDHATDLG